MARHAEGSKEAGIRSGSGLFLFLVGRDGGLLVELTVRVAWSQRFV